MFNSKNVYHYIFAFSVIVVASYFANKVKGSFTDNDEYELIKKYLLNDSPLYGFNKPKIWIHTKYEINARKWKSFYSRNTTDLNEPYIHLTIKSIINHCGNDFNICLIDDETFSKLLPSWDVDLASIAEPFKSRYRELGLLKLVYYYGGMVVPNSFLCSRNLKELFYEGTANGQPFFCEKVNHCVNNAVRKNKMLFTPCTFFFGATKNSETIKEFIEYLKLRNANPHFNSEVEFLGDSSEWIIQAANNNKVTVIGGEKIGVKTAERKQVALDNLMEEQHIQFVRDIYGIYLDNDEMLKRTKFNWLAVISSEELLQKNNSIFVKYLKASIVDSTSEYTKPNVNKSVISI